MTTSGMELNFHTSLEIGVCSLRNLEPIMSIKLSWEVGLFKKFNTILRVLLIWKVWILISILLQKHPLLNSMLMLLLIITNIKHKLNMLKLYLRASMKFMLEGSHQKQVKLWIGKN